MEFTADSSGAPLSKGGGGGKKEKPKVKQAPLAGRSIKKKEERDPTKEEDTQKPEEHTSNPPAQNTIQIAGFRLKKKKR